MAAPLQQPRVEGAGTRGRDEGHAALVSSRKRPRVVAETHDDSVAFARAASLRASDYGAWLSECKTRWRSLRNKLALVRNFVKLEANGDSLELGGILDPTGARAREKKRGFSRWKTVRAEEVRVGDIPHLTGDFKRLLAMLEAHPVTGGRAPPGDGKETGGEGAAAAADAADAAADAAAGASRFAFEGERLEDSVDDLTSSASDDADEDDLDEDDLDEDDSDEDADDRLGGRGTEGGTERPSGAHLQTSRRLAASVASAEPERSAADALAAYGDDPQPPPPPSFAPPPSAFATLPHAAVARESRATLATLMPPPPPQPQLNAHTRSSPRAALGAPASGAAGALAAYGFDEIPVFPQAQFAPQARVPDAGAGAATGASGAPGLGAHDAMMPPISSRGAPLNPRAFEDPWRHPVSEQTGGSSAARGFTNTDASSPPNEAFGNRVGAAYNPEFFNDRAASPRATKTRAGSGSPKQPGLRDGPLAADDELRAAAALCAKPWLDLSVGDVETVLAQVKYLISRRRRAHKQGRAQRRRVRADAAAGAAADTAAGAAAAAAAVAASADAAASTAPAASRGHTCVACNRVFSLPHQLQDHMHEHAGTAPHRCPFPGCARAFANRASLSRHKRTHEKRHSCAHPGCGRNFPSQYALRVHERSHSDDRPFACDVPGCGKRFKDEYTLVTHARVHTGEKRFACGEDGVPGCGKRFGYKVDLKRHREVCAVARGAA